MSQDKTTSGSAAIAPTRQPLPALRHDLLETYLGLADELTSAKAAGLLALDPSGVSRQRATHRQHLGRPLLQSGRTAMTLSPLGAEIFPSAQVLVLTGHDLR